MKTTLEISLSLAALFVCVFFANASLETENNEVNVSKCAIITPHSASYCCVFQFPELMDVRVSLVKIRNV